MRQSSFSSLNLEMIIKLMSPARQHLASLTGKDVVLFIGRTRSGKSTSINYLCGTKMKREKNRGDYKIAPLPGEVIYTDMSDTRLSVTFYPQTIQDSSRGTDFVYCDCPGYNDNRGNAEKICTSIMMQLAVNQVKSVKAVVICVPRMDLSVTGQTNLEELLKTIGDLFNNLGQCAPSIFFLITHIPDPEDAKHDDILQLIRDAKEAEEEKLKKHEAEEKEKLASTQKSESFSGILPTLKMEIDSKDKGPKPINEMDEMKKNIKILNIILSRPENIILLNPADQGNSRENLLTRIKSTSGSIDIKNFRLLKRDNLYLQFYDQILKKASEARLIIDRKNRLMDMVSKMILDFRKEEKDLNNKKELQIQKNGNQIDVNALLAEEKEKLADLIKETKKNISNLETENANLENELKSIDSDAPIKFWEVNKSYSPDPWMSATILGLAGGGLAFATQLLPTLVLALRGSQALAGVGSGLLGGYRIYQWMMRNLRVEQFEYPYEIPFLNAGAEIQPKISGLGREMEIGGYSYGEERKKEQGVYKITYLPNPLVSSSFSVWALIRSKDFPGNEHKISQNKQKTEQNEQDILKYQTDLSSHQERMKLNEAKLSEIRKNVGLDSKLSTSHSEKFLEQTIHEIALRIEKLRESIDKFNQEIQNLDNFLRSHTQIYQFVFDIIEMAKHDVYDQDFCETLLKTYIDWRSASVLLKPDSSKESKYTPVSRRPQLRKTKADGDCAYHAILGEWDESERMYWCRDAASRRKAVSEAVLKVLNKKSDSPLYKIVEESIKELVWSNRHIGPEIKKLIDEYQSFLSERDKNGSIFWDNFITELLQRTEYNDIQLYIDKHGTPNGLQTPRAKFYDALNKREGELYGRIMSLPKLHRLFCDFNNSQNEEFKWSFTKEIAQEYTNFLLRPKQWLLPGELAIIAHVFNKTVRYFPAENAKAMILNPKQPERVDVQFVDNNHFRRLSDRSSTKLESKLTSLGKRKDRDDAYEKFKNKMDELKGDRFIIKRFTATTTPSLDNLQISLAEPSSDPLKITELVSFLGKALEEKIRINSEEYKIDSDLTSWKIIITAEKTIIDKIEQLIKDIGKKHLSYGRMFNRQPPSNFSPPLQETENSCKIC
ncbi:MAG: 50S ribosome-binding GTPase [Proteobacteria bacterium]|nr:50S ribosome-binding GTPase [Pseudomonadota bacterium]